jgi:hypothetical protein
VFILHVVLVCFLLFFWFLFMFFSFSVHSSWSGSCLVCLILAVLVLSIVFLILRVFNEYIYIISVVLPRLASISPLCSFTWPGSSSSPGEKQVSAQQIPKGRPCLNDEQLTLSPSPALRPCFFAVPKLTTRPLRKCPSVNLAKIDPFSSSNRVLYGVGRLAKRMTRSNDWTYCI